MLIGILKAALTVVVFGATQSGPGKWIHALVSAFYDPDWNNSHRGVIWATIIFVLFFAGLGFPLHHAIFAFATWRDAVIQIVAVEHHQRARFCFDALFNGLAI